MSIYIFHQIHLESIQLILRFNHFTLIHEIRQHRVRGALVQRCTLACLRADAPVARCGVGVVCSAAVWDVGAEYVDVKEVVDDVHSAVGGGTRGTVDAAVFEGFVCDVVWRFEVVFELVENVFHR